MACCCRSGMTLRRSARRIPNAWRWLPHGRAEETPPLRHWRRRFRLRKRARPLPRERRAPASRIRHRLPHHLDEPSLDGRSRPPVRAEAPHAVSQRPRPRDRAVGSGKSTTLAALVDEINRSRHDHIITLEDPIEYVIPSKDCHVTQREVHTHEIVRGGPPGRAARRPRRHHGR